MKSNAQWYLLLPEPYRMQALNNAERDDQLGKEASSLAAALCAFPWETTPQDYKYWEAVYIKAREGLYQQDKN